jgi:hypothetical protein
MADTQLAAEIGSQFARLLHGELDEIGKACEMDIGQVSFSVTCVFSRDKHGELTARLEPRKRIPQAPIELKLTIRHGQLELFL